MSSSIAKKEKAIVPSSNPSPNPVPKSQRQKSKRIWIGVVIFCFIVFRVTTYLHFWHATDKAFGTPSNNCPQANVLTPEENGKIWTELNEKIGSAAFKQIAIDWLAGAVRIPWVSPTLWADQVVDKSKNRIIWWNGSSRSRPKIWSFRFIPRLSIGCVPSHVKQLTLPSISWDLYSF